MYSAWRHTPTIHTSYTLHPCPDAYLTRSLQGSTHAPGNSTTVITVSVPAADILAALWVSRGAGTTTVRVSQVVGSRTFVRAKFDRRRFTGLVHFQRHSMTAVYTQDTTKPESVATQKHSRFDDFRHVRVHVTAITCTVHPYLRFRKHFQQIMPEGLPTSPLPTTFMFTKRKEVVLLLYRNTMLLVRLRH